MASRAARSGKRRRSRRRTGAWPGACPGPVAPGGGPCAPEHRRRARRWSCRESERPARERPDARRVVGGEQAGALPAKLRELRVEELGTGLVERAVGLVEHEQLRLVQEDTTESEPLRHAA